MDYTPPPGSPGAGGPEWRTVSSEEWQDLGGFSDFFSSLFGRGVDRRAGRGRSVRMSFPGSDVEAELPVMLDDLLRGGRRRLTLDGRSIDVDIPSGAREGTVLRLAGQGEKGVNGGPPGDLYLHLRLIPHLLYRVVGDDLEMDLPLWPWQAVLGGEVQVETPDGAVSLRVPPGTQSGRRLRLRGRGLPRPGGGRGDLFAVVRIVVPERPSAAEREAYETLRRAVAADRPAAI
jgi:curved DNA-binding protein